MLARIIGLYEQREAFAVRPLTELPWAFLDGLRSTSGVGPRSASMPAGRYRSDLTPHHCLLFEGRTLDIEAVLPNPCKTRLVLMCTELV